jgi:hypothetical protein
MFLKVMMATALLAACGAPAQQPKSGATKAPVIEPLVVTTAGVGPLTAETPATLNGLRSTLAGYDVKPVNRSEGLEYVVSKNGETMFFVIPDPDADGKILNIHITSAKAIVQARTWAIGKPLGNADAAVCECWGDKPTCFQKGDHVAASFDRTCDEYDPDIRKRLASVPVARIVWSPAAFDGDGTGGPELGGVKDPAGYP